MAINQGGIGGMVRRNVEDFYANKRKIADELANRASAYEPIYDPWHGIAKLATAGIAGWNRDRLTRRQQEDEKNAAQTIAQALQGDQIDYNAMAGNQFTAPLAAELQLNERQAKLDRNQRREDGLFGQGLQLGPDGQLGFIPGYLESQERLAGLRGSNGPETWQPGEMHGVKGLVSNRGDFKAVSQPGDKNLTPWGNSSQALAVQELVNSGKITPDQATIWMSSITVTDPSTNAIQRIDPTKLNETKSSISSIPAAQSGQGVTLITSGKQSDKVKTDASNMNSIRASFDTYSKLLSEVGPDPVGSWLGSPKAIELEAAHRDLLLNLKEAYKLGVLNGPDYQLMLDVVNDPNSLRGGWIGKDGLQSQLKIIQNKLDKAQADFLNANPGASNLITTPSAPLNSQNTAPSQPTTQSPTPKIGKPVLDAQGNLVDSATGKIIVPAGK